MRGDFGRRSGSLGGAIGGHIGPVAEKLASCGEDSGPRGAALAKLDAALEMADAQFVLFHIRAMNGAAAGTWQRHAWLLERRPDSPFSQVQKAEIGKPGDFAKMSPDEITARILSIVGKPAKAGEIR